MTILTLKQLEVIQSYLSKNQTFVSHEATRELNEAREALQQEIINARLDLELAETAKTGGMYTYFK